MPCVGDRGKCELARDSKRCLHKMLNGGRRIAATAAPRIPVAAQSQPSRSRSRSRVRSITIPQRVISIWLMAANAGRVTESFAALEAIG
jgi:hypothetical protein